MEELNLLQKIAVWALPVIFAITIHEVAHGWVANRLGDPTARMLGRLTLNPVKHVDPVGTLLVPGILLFLGGFIFGWAKPVPVTWENLKNPKRDMALVALAGPVSNLLQAFFWALIMKLGLMLSGDVSWLSRPMLYMGVAGITINIILMVLNMLPLPPLDGGRVMAGLLPGPLSWQYSRIEPYGLVILLVLLITGILGDLLGPVIHLVQTVLFAIFGL